MTDIADVYARGKTERVVANVMQNYTRKDFVISSKIFWSMSDNVNDRGLSRKHIRESIESSAVFRACWTYRRSFWNLADRHPYNFPERRR
ncbi:MAG: aldo/keto reductase [Candidatus Hodarchaeota archaeon]